MTVLYLLQLFLWHALDVQTWALLAAAVVLAAAAFAPRSVALPGVILATGLSHLGYGYHTLDLSARDILVFLPLSIWAGQWPALWLSLRPRRPLASLWRRRLIGVQLVFVGLVAWILYDCWFKRTLCLLAPLALLQWKPGPLARPANTAALALAFCVVPMTYYTEYGCCGSIWQVVSLLTGMVALPQALLRQVENRPICPGKTPAPLEAEEPAI